MVTAAPYGAFAAKALNKEVDFDTDTVKAMLAASTYTPDLLTHDYKNDVTNEVSGTGYTAGGATLASKTVTYTAANSWGTSRANTTAYTLGQVVRPATGNGFLYMASTAGTSGGSIPTYPTNIGGTVTDGTVAWTNMGTGITVFDCADPAWGPAATISGIRYLIHYVDTGTAATSALISLVDFVSDQAVSNGTFTYQEDPTGVFRVFTG